ncbi:hypothetical protein SDJN02_19115, partial [Cucurbita argyrosperma subsp. argyrosperma]
MYTSLVTLESECEEYGITLIPPIDFICEEAPKSYEIKTSRAYLYGERIAVPSCTIWVKPQKSILHLMRKEMGLRLVQSRRLELFEKIAEKKLRIF